MEEGKVPEMITIREASARTGIRYEAIRGMCINGAVVYIRIGKKYLINWESLKTYFNSGEKQCNLHSGGRV